MSKKYIVGFRFAGTGSTVLYYQTPGGVKNRPTVTAYSERAHRFNIEENAHHVGRLLRPAGGTYFIKGG